MTKRSRLPLARRVAMKVKWWKSYFSIAPGFTNDSVRIGWLACKDRDVLVRLERYKHYLSICNSAPSEALAKIALKAREQILERNRRIVSANLAAYDQLFGEHRDLFDWKVPDGGCVAFPRYKGKEGVEEFTRRLVEKTGILFLPASIFRSELSPVPIDRLRIGFGRRHVTEGIRVLRAWLHERSR